MWLIKDGKWSFPENTECNTAKVVPNMNLRVRSLRDCEIT